MKIAIGGDHAGFLYKEQLKSFLEPLQYEIIDFGPFSDESVDYPDYVHPLAAAVENGLAAFGILICGSGQGVCITANKHKGIRAALVWEDEVAKLARQHNNANVLCLPARFLSFEKVALFVTTFLTTYFEGGRHLTRVNKISC